MNWRSARVTKIAGALTLVLTAGLGWLGGLGPQTGELAGIRDGIESTRAQNNTLEVQLRKLEAKRKGLDKTRATARALATRFPPTADQPALFRQVTAAAVRAGIPADDVTELAPAAPVAGTDEGDGVPLPGKSANGELAVQVVAIAVEGGYDQIQRLLENLEDLPRAYLVSSISLTAGQRPGMFTASVSGQMFVMPRANDPARASQR